jgi:hypothetical protein
MKNAKKNLVFHFGVGRQAAFLKIGYVKRFKTRTIEVMGVITFSLYEKTEKSAIIC